jgi:hypothetical protein
MVLASLVFTGCLLVLRERWHDWVETDEAYVWYGTLRLLEGEVPVRDFRSYEPGRYLWCAPFLLTIKRGVLAIRIASNVFYALALTLGLVVLSTHGVGQLPLLTLGTTALSTVAEPYKLFEPAFAWLWIAAATLLVSAPSMAQGLLLGVVVGMAATFGLNLALYTGGASLVLVGWLWLQGLFQPAHFVGLAVGTVLGAAPLIFYALGSPGFLAALMERRVLTVLRRGTTNLPLPIPWPWRTRWRSGTSRVVVRKWCAGLAFVVLPLIPVLAVVLLLWPGHPITLKTAPGLAAAAILGLFAWHHAYSRADRRHLYQSHIPALVTAVLLVDRWPKGWVIFATWVVLVLLLSVRRLGRTASRAVSVTSECDGWRLHSSPQAKLVIDRVQEQLASVAAPAREWLVALPWTLWLLPMLKLRSPVYDTFCVYPASVAEQAKMISEIESSPVVLALVDTSNVDGDPRLSFVRTHPLVTEWLLRHFQKIDCGLPEHLLMLRR